MEKTVVLLLSFTLCFSVVLSICERDQHRYGSQPPFRKANQQFVERQQLVLKLYQYVNQPNYYQDYVELAKTYKIENELGNYNNSQYVKELFGYFDNKTNKALLQNEIFSPFIDRHLKQAITLYKVLYYAKSFEVFYKTAVWARYNLSQGLYLYSLSVAILHRPDTYGIALPAIYEVYPYYFYNAEFTANAQAYQELRLSQPNGPSSHLVYNYSQYYNADSEQSVLGYYLEDVGINAFYYYYNLYHPQWLEQEYGYVNSYQRGEEFYYFYQQLLARYQLERISNSLFDVPVYSYKEMLKEPYYSYLSYANGIPFPSRPHNSVPDFDHQENYYWESHYEALQRLDERFYTAIDFQHLFLLKDKPYDLSQPEGFNALSNAVEDNSDSLNRRSYGHLQNFARTFLGNSFRGFSYHPSVLEQYETSLRDPVFYRLYKKILSYLLRYKYYLPNYSYSELEFFGVKVNNIEIEELVTYFENYNGNVAYAFYYGNENSSFSVPVSQSRLNHKPFVYKINVESQNSVDSVVRVFIGPKNKLAITYNRAYFVELDRFKYHLESGNNVIKRNSYQIYSGDYYGIQDWEYKVKSVLESGEYYNVYGSEVLYGYPNRYALPKGSAAGQEYQLYVIVSPYKPYNSSEYVERQQQFKQEQEEYPEAEGVYQEYYYPYVGLGVSRVDSYDLGYPFDRHIPDEDIFNVPNSYFKTVKVYLKSESEINESAPHQ